MKIKSRHDLIIIKINQNTGIFFNHRYNFNSSAFSNAALCGNKVIIKYQRYYSTNSASLNQEGLGPYLAGLIEGDGYIYAPDPQDFSTKQKWVAHIEIVLT